MFDDVTTMTTVGKIQAHANGIAGLAIMTTDAGGARRSRTALAYEEGGEQGEGVGGLLVTCGNAEGVVKIWDYTHVEDDGGCGRYELRRSFLFWNALAAGALVEDA